MTAGIYNIICEQGATFTKSLLWEANSTPVDLTGYTAKMQVRTNLGAASVIVELSTENSRIALGGVAGTINLSIPASITATLLDGSYSYDLELYSGSNTYRLIQGQFIITGEITK
jgi:hypothetical protein